jgi:SpoVK/Ycf46/Vps4 family AAA+-type ATPase
VPLLRLDFGALYDKYYGETEKNLRRVLETAEVMAPCVLWMDEIEKGIASGATPTGSGQRVLGTLLTWMAERKSAVFIVATANDISRLPPELIRKGRWTRSSSSICPTPEVRERIFEIHLRRRGLDPAGSTCRCWPAAEGFSGAGIEQAVVSAVYAAEADDTPVGDATLLGELARTQPLSVVMADRRSGPTAM